MNTGHTKEPDAGHGVIQAVSDRARSYVDGGVNALKTASGKARRIGVRADRYVHKNPWMVIGVAAGVGVLIGYLIRSRRES